MVCSYQLYCSYKLELGARSQELELGATARSWNEKLYLEAGTRSKKLGTGARS